MDVEELSLVGPTVDLATVDSIHRKRIVAFVNHFLIHTAKFLNNLSANVESKLLTINLRLQKLEAAVILLECKLNSIPKLNDTVVLVDNPTNVPEETKVEKSEAILEEPKVDEESSYVKDDESEDNKPIVDENLLKYIKMLHVGVPLPAVKLKMQQEGLTAEQQKQVLQQ